MDESSGGSRIVYPKLLATLTEADLVSQFRLAPEERVWAGTAARRGPSMVVLLTHAIRTHLAVTPWGASARAVASNAVALAAETRLDPAQLVNAAIDALIRERCELPSLSTLLRLAGNAHRRINSTQWQQVHERLTALDGERLDELLTPSADYQDSPFAVMCRGAGKATRDITKKLRRRRVFPTATEPYCPGRAPAVDRSS